ncbi:MAG: hypothetical protein AAGF12_25530 [Myxococcota bacterium]
MSLPDLMLIYGVAGVGFAVAIARQRYRRVGPRQALWAGALAVPLWPLWAPIALTTSVGERRAPVATAASLRIERALREGVEAAAGSPMEELLSKDAETRILDEVVRTEARCQELDGILGRSDFRLDEAEARVERLEAKNEAPRSIATARLQLENVRRLHRIRDRDREALTELADLVDALRTQLVLSRYAGSSVEGVGGIVSEVWNRVEGLGEALDDPALSVPEVSSEVVAS